jgi:hypothetical protein
MVVLDEDTYDMLMDHAAGARDLQAELHELHAAWRTIEQTFKRLQAAAYALHDENVRLRQENTTLRGTSRPRRRSTTESRSDQGGRWAAGRSMKKQTLTKKRIRVAADLVQRAKPRPTDKQLLRGLRTRHPQMSDEQITTMYGLSL